jgi:hypothetical protein
MIVPFGLSPNGSDVVPSGAFTSAMTKSQAPTSLSLSFGRRRAGQQSEQRGQDHFQFHPRSPQTALKRL